MTETIHASLAEHYLLPDKHVADTGYVNSSLFVSSRTSYGIDLIEPTGGDNHWQTEDGGGLAARDCTIDWEQQQAICPMGNPSNSWMPAIDRFKNEVIKIKFATKDCQGCPSCAHCTRSTPACRTITLRPQAQHAVLVEGRKREQTAQFKAEYAKHAGIEGRLSQDVRVLDLRCARYRGFP